MRFIKLIKQSNLIKIFLLVTLAFLVLGCDLPAQQANLELNQDAENTTQVDANADVNVQEQQNVTPEIVEDLSEIESLVCEDDSECEWNENCIDGACGTIDKIYKITDCAEQCTVNSVKISTSDNEEYDLILGRGSYTAAGALQWTLLPSPTHCPEEDVIIPIQIEKKTTGKTLNKQVLTLKQGQTSSTITHPLMPDLSFTLQISEVMETCE